MERGRGRRVWLLLAAAALAVALLRFTAHGLPPWAAPVSGAAQRLLAPLEGAAARAAGAVRAAGAFAVRTVTLNRQYAALARRAEQVPLLEARVEELQQENARLRALLALAPAPGYRPVAARVVARNPDRWFATAVLGKGTGDGLAPGMAVVAAGGLAGRLTAVGPGTATVLLLTDPQSGVGARVQREGSRAEGVVLGQAGRGDVLLMRLFQREADVRRGDRVVSSDLSGQLPAGLPIGTVTEVYDDPRGPVRYARLRPAVAFDRLAEVLVLVPAAGGGGG